MTNPFVRGGDWITLDLTREQIEVLAHMTIKAGPPEQLVADLWPALPESDGLERLDAEVEAINAAASSATGKPGRVILRDDQQRSPGEAVPEMFVRVMGVPYVEVR